MLLECSIAILILLILLTISTQSYSSTSLRLTGANLAQAIKSARLIAMIDGTTVTICPSHDHISCAKIWQDSNEVIFQKKHLTYKHITLNNSLSTWKASLANNPSITFLANGKTNGEQGSISLHNKTNHYKITVNRNGNITTTS